MAPGQTFKLFSRYRNGTRRPKFSYREAPVRLGSMLKRVPGAYDSHGKPVYRVWAGAHLRLGGHYEGPMVVEISRPAFDYAQELTVVEHLREFPDCTMVRDENNRVAPICSDIVLQVRTQANVNNKPRARHGQPRRSVHP